MTAVTQDMVLEKLKNVVDPELFVNVVDLGLIYEINLEQAAAAPPAGDPAEADDPESEGNPAQDADQSTGDSTTPPAEGLTNVQINMTMTSPACPAGPQLIGGAKQQVSSIEGVGEVEVRIVMDPPWTPDRMTEDAKDQLGIF